jgi:hypothetical protein
MAAWSPNPLMMLAIPIGLLGVFGLFRFHFGRDTLSLAMSLAAILLGAAILVTYLSGEDVIATLTFSYPSHSAAIAFPIGTAYALVLWSALCAIALAIGRTRRPR